MSTNERGEYSNLRKGDIGYIMSAGRVTSTSVGIVFEIDDARPPHIKLRFPDGTISHYLDYDSVRLGGKLPRQVVSGATATVHLVPVPADGSTPHPSSIREQQWEIEQVSDEYTHHEGMDFRWVLVQAESPTVKLWLRTGSTFRTPRSILIRLVRIPDDL